MALDKLGLAMAAPYIRGHDVLCLGYPDITAPHEQVERLLGVRPRVFTEHNKEHQISWNLPETVDTLKLAGAGEVDCVDIKPSRGVEREVDLNQPYTWGRRYGLVINPGTVEHCFNIATAMFNAWRAVDVGGVLLHVVPVSMVNHGFWNVCPTAIVDFARENAGMLLRIAARDREWRMVDVDHVKRCTVPPEVVLYATVQKVADTPEVIPTQWRYR